MIKLLAKTFVKDYKNTESIQVRSAYGVMMSVVGIVANVLLSALKLLLGSLCGSIAITADAVNNLSDAGAQTVSLISFKISAKPPDRDHPFGHARIEYVASMIVSFLILLVGFELLKESVVKIIEPTELKMDTVTLVALGISVGVKLWLGFSCRSLGKRLASPVMVATATDSMSDAVATTAILVSAVISKITGIQTDAYVGVAVSALIFVAGIRILNETKNSILGSPPDPAVVEKIISVTREYPEICGIHDMVVHNYGVGNTIASLHAEVDGSQNVFVIHEAIDDLERRLFAELGVRATVHMDPIVLNDERVNELRALVLESVKMIDIRLSIHDFRFVEGVSRSNLIFDVTAPFEFRLSDSELTEKVGAAVRAIDSTFCAVVTVDRQ